MAAQRQPLTKEEREKCRVVTPEGRVSYPHVFKAAQVQGQGEPKFSLTLLFPKKADLTGLKNAIHHAKVTAYGPNKAAWPKGLLSPVSDGDDPKYEGKEGYKGHYVVKATSNAENRPQVVDENVELITEAGEFYPGCYARASLFAHAWSFMGKQGVSFILDSVQKTKDGKSLSGKRSASETFSPVQSTEGDTYEEEENEEEESDSFL